jgi:hypothetical protein
MAFPLAPATPEIVMAPFPVLDWAYRNGLQGEENGCVWSLRHPFDGEYITLWLDTWVATPDTCGFDQETTAVIRYAPALPLKFVR